MTKQDNATETKSQLDKFKEAARALECDQDEARWNEKLKQVARHKEGPEPK
jgi:hypothetical protein